HPCCRRPLPHNRDEAFHRIRSPLEQRLDGAVRVVADPPGDALALSRVPDRVAEENALHTATGHHALAHAARLSTTPKCSSTTWLTSAIDHGCPLAPLPSRFGPQLTKASGPSES